MATSQYYISMQKGEHPALLPLLLLLKGKNKSSADDRVNTYKEIVES